jgi:hypothetical protein
MKAKKANDSEVAMRRDRLRVGRRGRRDMMVEIEEVYMFQRGFYWD